MSSPTNAPDIIATQILFDTKEALKNLDRLNKEVTDAAAKQKGLKDIIKAVAKQINGDMTTAANAVGKLTKALGINPVLIKNLGKELQLIQKIAEQTGWSIEAVEKKLAGLAIVVSNSQGSIATIGQSFSTAFGSSVPVLTQVQTALMLISGQIGIIKSQLSGGVQSRNATPLLGSGGQGGGGAPPDYIDAQWEEVADGAGKASKATEDFGKKADTARKNVENLGDRGSGSLKKLDYGLYTLRIAFGFLISMLVSNAFQFFINNLKQASDLARQLEENIWRLGNAERALSKEGVDITLQGMEDSITRIQQKFKVFSREDISQLYSSIAVATKQLGLSEKEINDLTEAVVFLNIQSAKQEDLMTTQASTLSTLLGKNSVGIAQLGVSFKDEFIQQEAVRMGMLKLGEATSKLTEEQVAHIKVSLLAKAGYVDSAEGLDILNKFLDTNSAKIQTNKSAWQDLLATIGQGINNALPKLDSVFSTFQKRVEETQLALLFRKNTGDGLFLKPKDIAVFEKLSRGMELSEKEASRLKDVLASIPQNEILKVFPDPSAIKNDVVREYVQNLIDVVDTATAAPDPLLPDPVDQEQLDALDDMEKKMQDILLEAQQAQEDLDVKRTQKLEDLDLEYIRKNEDAAREHAQKIEDINQDALDKIEDAKRKSREDEKKAEQDLLQKLKELRQRFLLDLEDAVRQRDARQVLRLIKEYQLDKQNILDKKKLDDQQRKDSLAADLEAIEIERKRRLESEQIEYARRIRDLNEAKARELEDLQTWYDREQEDIQRNIQQKLEKLIEGYAQEYGLHEESQAKIYGLLQEYFGKDTALVDNLAQYMAQRFAEMQAIASTPIVPAVSPFTPISGVTSGLNAPVSNYGFDTGLAQFKQIIGNAGGFAEGGTLIAKRPTVAVFGEKSPEMVQFTPLDRQGRDVNKVFGDVSGMGANGNLGLRISISDGLIAEIIDSSMENVAVTIDHARRER